MGASRHLIGIICAVLMCLSACVTTGADGRGAGRVGNAGAPELEAGVQLLPLSFQISGGFAGRVEALDIAADGLATLTDMRSRTTWSAQLPPSNLDPLRVLLTKIAGAEIAEGGPRFPGRCRDCFEYRVTLNSMVKPLNVVVTSDRLSASAYRELIVLLLAIGDDVKRKSQ